MKKYQLGALTVSDKGLQDTKEEIVIELIDRMRKSWPPKTEALNWYTMKKTKNRS